MVSFMRIRYSLALEHSEIQRQILEDATRGLDSLDSVDWAAADVAVLAQLTPLVEVTMYTQPT
jgi:kynurenine 3-monooxygenase